MGYHKNKISVGRNQSVSLSLEQECIRSRVVLVPQTIL